jgi:hypothetical protein
MVAYELINHTRVDTDWAQRAVNKLCRDLDLRKLVRFVFEDTWTDIDEETGRRVFGTESREAQWTGEAWSKPEESLVRISLPCHTLFPVIWDIDSPLPGDHQTHQQFHNPWELFLYLAAHELRRQWQREYPQKLDEVIRLFDLYPEADAAIYALRILERYRQNPAEFGE